MTEERTYSLHETAAILGVHYMTTYRYIRTGRLQARLAGARWLISGADIEAFERTGHAARGPHGARSRPDLLDAERLLDRLHAGDENGSWGIAQELLAGGATPKDVYLYVLVPALRLVGERYSAGAMTIADEHRSSVIAQRLIGRMGPLFRTRGPRIGTIVIGAPAGERHSIPTALVADILRGEGFEVVDLGADVPADAFATFAAGIDGLVGIAIAVTMSRYRRSAADVVRALRQAEIKVPILVGGAGVDASQALEIGADYHTPDTDAVVLALRQGRSALQRAGPRDRHQRLPPPQ